jgi:methylmalonyl-CoA mutase
LEFSWRYKSKTILSFRWYKNFEVNTKVSEFKICQNIFVFDIEKSIERAIDTLARGESLFTIEDNNIDM